MPRLAPWDPFTALSRMDREFDTLVRRTWPAPAATRAGFVPAVEIARDGEDVLVVLELPGVDVARDVSIEVDRGKLVISGERRDPRAEDDNESVLVRELRYGSFRREFALPGGVSAEQVEAGYDAGLLLVRVKRVVQPEPMPVKVPISTGEAQPARVLEGPAE
ncbi:MAG: heat shock protein [Frankiales bacterium]|nr:heat shock protein [Frankiales bacterium]